MADCDLCGRPQSDAAYACARCATRCRDALLQLAELAPELDATIARLSRVSSGGATVDDPLPINVGAAADAWAVVNVIDTWLRHVSSRRGTSIQAIPERDHHALADAAVVLAGQLDWLRRQPEGSEALDELVDACALAVRTVDRRAVRWYAGPCGSLLPGGDLCQEDLYAATGASTVNCGACAARHDARARKEWLLVQARDQLAHAELIGRALAALDVPVDPARVRTWAARGHITAHANERIGDKVRPLYRVGDVEEVALRMAVRSGRAMALDAPSDQGVR